MSRRRRRGLTDEELAAARALLARVQRGPSSSEPVVDPEARATAEAHLWAWYLEWSGIARATVKDRRVLAALGLRPRGRKKKKKPEG